MKLTSDQLNRWLSLGANLGVLLGIILLVVELDQNRDMIRAQTRNDLSWQVTDFLSRIAADAELSSLKRRAELGEDLTVEEEQRYKYHFFANTRIWENFHYQYRQGMFDDIEYQAAKKSWGKLIVVNKRFAQNWCSGFVNFSQDFEREINNLLDDDACSEFSK